MRQLSYILCVVSAVLFCNKAFAIVEFEPGVGVGLEYTTNATLANKDKVSDLIELGYVGASLSENDGPLVYEAITSLNKQRYTQNTFKGNRYFNLAANADWEMIRDVFDWSLNNYFTQRTINVLNSNTPDNLQNTNIFVFSADIKAPISARQRLTLTPAFKQYYYENSPINNKQYSLTANWDYKIYRLASVGLNFNRRKIDYFEREISGTTFTTTGATFSGQRVNSDFFINVGSTNVKRENEQEISGFHLNTSLLINISPLSAFNTGVSSELTDTSTVSAGALSNGSDVQLTTDVVRYSSVNMSYQRKGSSLQTVVRLEYGKVKYSESPLDQINRSVDARFDYPVSSRIESGAYASYSRIKRLQTERLDQYYIIGTNLKYHFSRELKGVLDLKYREKASTSASENYDEYSIFASLVYGFGEVYRPTRVGGF